MKREGNSPVVPSRAVPPYLLYRECANVPGMCYATAAAAAVGRVSYGRFRRARGARAILVLLHIEVVTRALPGPFSGSSPSGKAEAARDVYFNARASERAFSQFPQFPPTPSSFFTSSFSSSSSCLSRRRIVRLIIAVMPRGVKVYTIRPLIVDSSTTHSILADRRIACHCTV
jgi:hypothetical protein